MKLKPFYQSHRDLYNDTKHEGVKQQIHKIHHLWYISVLGREAWEGRGREEKGVINEHGGKFGQGGVIFSSPDYFYCFVAWHLFVEFLKFGFMGRSFRVHHFLIMVLKMNNCKNHCDLLFVEEQTSPKSFLLLTDHWFPFPLFFLSGHWGYCHYDRE